MKPVKVVHVVSETTKFERFGAGLIFLVAVVTLAAVLMRVMLYKIVGIVGLLAIAIGLIFMFMRR